MAKKGNKKKEKGAGHEEPTQYSFKKMEAFLKDWFQFKYNDVTNEIEYKPNDEDEWKTLDEIQLNGLYVWYRKQNIKFSKNDLIALLYSPSVERYNPFIDYFEGLPKWDGVDYIGQYCDAVQIVEKSTGSNSETERFKNQFAKMLLRQIACAIDDTFFNKQIFVLYGDTQNQYKSSYIRNLCPPALKKYYSENFNSDRDKDTAISICENFMINIDELAGLLKFEINKLKATLSRLNDKIRLPFAKRATLIPRRASFWGTTNKETFLTDETGNVRWICFHVSKIDLKGFLSVDMDKFWAQAFHLYKQGAELQVNIEEMKKNEEANAFHQEFTAEMDLVNKYFTQGSKDNADSTFFTSTEIVDHLSKLVTTSIRLTPVSIGRAMRYFRFTRDQRPNDEKKFPEKGYWIKCSCKLCKLEKDKESALAGSLN